MPSHLLRSRSTLVRRFGATNTLECSGAMPMEKTEPSTVSLPSHARKDVGANFDVLGEKSALKFAPFLSSYPHYTWVMTPVPPRATCRCRRLRRSVSGKRFRQQRPKVCRERVDLERGRSRPTRVAAWRGWLCSADVPAFVPKLLDVVPFWRAFRVGVGPTM